MTIRGQSYSRCSNVLTLDDVLPLVESFDIPVGRESPMQLAIERQLRLSGIGFDREHRLAKRDRIDFLIDGGVGIEVKVGQSYTAVALQLLRYTESELVTGLILVTTRSSHRQLNHLPNERNVPIRVFFASLYAF